VEEMRALFWFSQSAFSDLVFVEGDKLPKRSVISFFYIIGKETGGKFVHIPVILEAFAAEAFSAARFICAVTVLKIFFFFAFLHVRLPLRKEI
jgi:hypothetical protein